jgi:hypothetical protein
MKGADLESALVYGIVSRGAAQLFVSVSACALAESPNEKEISCGGRESASPAAKTY